MFMTVDLPEPLGPITATKSPSPITKFTPRNAWKAACPRPYIFVTPENSMSGSPKEA